VIDTLYPVSRLVIRASLALFTCVVLVLIQSAFWSARVSASMQAIIFAIALLSYFRPHYGLFALAVLTPLGQVGSRTLDSQMRGAEALVLAFLAGALVRGWTLREFRTFPSTRLHVAALIFGFVVAASCIEQIWFTQIQMDFAWPFAQDVLSYASRNYVTSSRFGMLPRAMWLLEGLALLLFTAHYLSTSAQFTRRLIITLIFGAIATAMLTLTAVAAEFGPSRESAGSVIDFFARGRWSGHISDVNAAGSYFAMMAFLALGTGFREREWRWAWIASGSVLLVTTLMTGSRTAVAATGGVAVLVFARAAFLQPSYALRAASVAGVLAVVGMAASLIFRTTGAATPSQAVSIRWMFLQATAGMLVAEPAFGVGIGQFSLWSAHFAPPALFKIWRPDNAHNNLAQIAGELGIVGFIAFCVVLAAPFAIRSKTPDRNPLLSPLIAGLGVYILTWLGGHPLLVPEAAYPFWITLGAATALGARDSIENVSPVVVAFAIALLLASIPFRVSTKSSDLDFTKVSYGVSTRQLMISRARLFVPGSESRIDIPLRARSASEDVPVDIEVFVDGSASETIALHDRNWRKAPIDLPRDPSRRFHQIDLLIRPHALDSVDPDRSLVEVGKWEIITKPNG
jgi:hypothetical protein